MFRARLVVLGVGAILLAVACGDNNDNGSNNTGQQQSTDMFKRTDLVADGAGAAHADSNLVNAWGLDRGPNTYLWSSNNGTGTSTVYDGNGGPQTLVVSLPAPGGDAGAPTGVVYNGSADFVVTGAQTSGPAVFIFVSEDGTILGWNPQATPTTAVIAVDHSGDGAIYKGVTIGQRNGQNTLYVANFSRGTVDVFDGEFHPVVGLAAGAFTDSQLPTGYAPFNVFYSGGLVYVAFALQDDQKEDEVAGPGNGRLIAFQPDGTLAMRFNLGDHANAPWGMADAPDGFGNLGGTLLVGNFGDGHIYAVDRTAGTFMTDLMDASGASIAVDGLWGLRFGNDQLAGSSQSLFFTAGPSDEQHGLLGRIEAVR